MEFVAGAASAPRGYRPRCRLARSNGPRATPQALFKLRRSRGDSYHKKTIASFANTNKIGKDIFELQIEWTFVTG